MIGRYHTVGLNFRALIFGENFNPALTMFRNSDCYICVICVCVVLAKKTTLVDSGVHEFRGKSKKQVTLKQGYR